LLLLEDLKKAAIDIIVEKEQIVELEDLLLVLEEMEGKNCSD